MKNPYATQHNLFREQNKYPSQHVWCFGVVLDYTDIITVYKSGMAYRAMYYYSIQEWHGVQGYVTQKERYEASKTPQLH